MIEGGAKCGMSVRAVCCLVPLTLFVLPVTAQDANVKVITTTIAGAGVHTECLTLSKTQSLRYWFRSDAPIEFSIQVQDARGAVRTVRRDKLAKGTGIYPAQRGDVHCMALANPARKSVTVRLEFARVE